MPRQPLYTAEPNVEIPFALRLAQFLLGASDQVGLYGQNLAQQSRLAQEAIEQDERSADRKTALAQRDFEFGQRQQDRAAAFEEQKRQSALQEEDRRLARADRQAKTQQEGLRLQALAKFRKGLQPYEGDLPVDMPATERGAPNAPANSTLPALLRSLIQPTVQESMGKLSDEELGVLPEDAIAKGRTLTGEDKEAKNEGLKQFDPEKDIYQGTKLFRAGTPAPPKADRAAALGSEVNAALAELGVTPETAAPADIAKARKMVQQGRVEVSVQQGAGRALGPQAPTADERQRGAEAVRTIELANQALKAAEANPDWFGGPFGATGLLRSLQARAGSAPEGFTEFKTAVDEMSGTYARRVAGAALTPTEERRYLSYLPDVRKDSAQEFMTKLRMMPQRAQELEAEIERRRLGTAAPPAPTAPKPAAAPAVDINAVDAELRKRGLLK